MNYKISSITQIGKAEKAKQLEEKWRELEMRKSGNNVYTMLPITSCWPLLRVAPLISPDPPRGTTRADWRRDPVVAREGPGAPICARATDQLVGRLADRPACCRTGFRVACQVTCGDLSPSRGCSEPLQFRIRGATWMPFSTGWLFSCQFAASRHHSAWMAYRTHPHMPYVYVIDVCGFLMEFGEMSSIYHAETVYDLQITRPFLLLQQSEPK